MGNIYYNSNHPVEIKKVKLNIWSLRDEIEAVIKERLNHMGEDNPEGDLNIDDLKNEYKAQEPLKLVENVESKEDNPATDGPMDEAKSEESSETESETEEAKETEVNGEGQQGLEVIDGDQSSEHLEVSFRTPHLAEEKLSSGICLLSDITMFDLCFFSENPFIYGQTLVIDFVVTKNFSVTIEVIKCTNYNIKSRIISKGRPPYRVHAKFIFLRKGEIALLRNFVKSIEPDIPADAPKAKAKAEAEGDFDDLDDLGL